jgi:hypothetical protein
MSKVFRYGYSVFMFILTTLTAIMTFLSPVLWTGDKIFLLSTLFLLGYIGSILAWPRKD